jgi:hypothetical protein
MNMKHSYRLAFHIMRSYYTRRAMIARKTALEYPKERTDPIVRNRMKLLSSFAETLDLLKQI